MIFFLIGWEDAHAHGLITEAGVQIPYIIAPRKLTRGKRLGPPPWWHGTPESYEEMARLVYNGLAQLMAWPAISPGEFKAPLFRKPPSGDWQERKQRYLTSTTTNRIEEQFLPHKALPGRNPCAGPMDCSNGLMGHATTVLVRRAAQSQKLTIS